jgi:hypothetical protein
LSILNLFESILKCISMKFPHFRRSVDVCAVCVYQRERTEAQAAKEINKISFSVFRLVVEQILFIWIQYLLWRWALSAPSNDIHSYISIFSRICEVILLYYMRRERKIVIEIIYKTAKGLQQIFFVSYI